MVLTGSEVKSLRNGKANIADSYAIVKDGEVFLLNLHISPYEQASYFNHEPTRTRKLLLHRKEIRKMIGAVERQGLTLIPLELYFKRERPKVGWSPWQARSSTTSARMKSAATTSATCSARCALDDRPLPGRANSRSVRRQPRSDFHHRPRRSGYDIGSRHYLRRRALRARGRADEGDEGNADHRHQPPLHAGAAARPPGSDRWDSIRQVRYADGAAHARAAGARGTAVPAVPVRERGDSALRRRLLL